VIYKYKTHLHLSLSGLGAADHAVPLEFEYKVSKGYPETREEPGEGPSVDFVKITLTDEKGIRYRAHDWLWELLEKDGELTNELLSEANAADQCAADDHADAMRREIRL
jgi:hypothetical protein